MKKVLTAILTLSLFLFPYKCFAARDYESRLDEITREYGVEEADISNITVKDVVEYLTRLLKEKATAPLKYTATLASVIILSAAAKAFSVKKGFFSENTVDSVCALVLFLKLLTPVTNIISGISENLTDVKNFMAAFLPVFAGITAAAGEFFTSTVYTGFFLTGMLFFSDICLYYILPSLRLYFALIAADSMSDAVRLGGIGDFYIKIAKGSMKTIVTVICFILTMQTALFSGKDTVAVKAGKFLAGSAVPVIGSALQDAVSSVYAGMEAIKGFAGVAGVMGVILIFLPSIAELAICGICTNFLYALCRLFDVKSCGKCVKGFINVINIVFSVVLLFAIMLVFSLTIMISLTNGV